MSDNLKRGMVLGKFMPPHRGHLYLMEFAKNYVDQLAVVVETQKAQPIPGEMRYRWVCQMVPDCQVVHLTDENPQDPSEHPDFWKIWHDSLRGVLPFEPDYVFASETYGWKLAEVMGARFVPVDIDRAIMPVSGTRVRERPLENWDHIPRAVRPYYALRVCIFGPESTGKSTLTVDLANHFQTSYVPEYARTHLESRGGEIDASDIPKIARGQMASEDALVCDANRILFCDTDLVTTVIWSHWLYGDCPDWIEHAANQRTYDLYLVLDVDVPWVDDSVRYLPEERRSFFDRCVQQLGSRNRRYTIISGSWQQRRQAAIAAVETLLSEEHPRR